MYQHLYFSIVYHVPWFTKRSPIFFAFAQHVILNSRHELSVPMLLGRLLAVKMHAEEVGSYTRIAKSIAICAGLLEV